MKRFESGAALAKGMGLDPKVHAETFSKYDHSVRTKKDFFGKVSLLPLSLCSLLCVSVMQRTS